ncbi:hypothetical protein Tco_0844801 [Tanacetum coccineum]
MHESSKTKDGDEASGMGGDETPFIAETKDVDIRIYHPTVALQYTANTAHDEVERMKTDIPKITLKFNPQHYQRQHDPSQIACMVNAVANKDTRDVPNALKQVENTTYRYYFRVVIDDVSAPTTITCVSPEAHSFVPECNAVIQGNKNEPSPSTKGTEEALQAMAEERKKKVKHQLFP